MQALAAIVQALAAGVTVGLTAVLVWATRRYVALTAELAKAATAGTEWQQRGAAIQRRFFCGVVGRLECLVEDLPQDRAESKMRAALVWKDEDVDQFLAFAASMGDETMVDAESAGPSLRWLADRVRYVQSQPINFGVRFDEEVPAAEWTRHLTLARRALAGIDRRETPANLAASVS